MSALRAERHRIDLKRGPEGAYCWVVCANSFARDGAVKVAVANVKSPADIGYDRKRDRVLMPLFMESKVQIQALKYPEGPQYFARPPAGLTYSHIGI